MVTVGSVLDGDITLCITFGAGGGAGRLNTGSTRMLDAVADALVDADASKRGEKGESNWNNMVVVAEQVSANNEHEFLRVRLT